ncbi:hypothetical protein PVK06_011705 [Gossypium arboreum]|uniref:Uncharacterized protein n=1 Tax=Gossypium arboreum TaxID=29729 RepID=A0ABR0Q9G9_GOSAR|nr:hypothetical protein PVK06_011705 [Gossypium arboreum]
MKFSNEGRSGFILEGFTQEVEPLDTKGILGNTRAVGQTLELILPPSEKILKISNMEATSQEIFFMALDQNSTILGEGHSTMRPPLFNGTNYSYCTTKMKLFIQANDYEVWRIITNAMHTLFCALGLNEYNRVSLCDNAKEILHKLEVTHEGTSRVKESKISLVILDYELFKAKLEEGLKPTSSMVSKLLRRSILTRRW